MNDHTTQHFIVPSSKENPGPNPSGLCMCGCGRRTNIADKSHTATGNVKGTPRRFIAGHQNRKKKGRPNPKNATHGMTNTKDYRLWLRIKARCYYKKSTGWAYYGGRGIRMHSAWRDDFLAFRTFIRQLPSYGQKGYTLDRIDNDGHYEPGNLRWTTVAQQNRNKRNIKMITFRGKTQCIADWARKFGLKPSILYGRFRRGWPIEKALTKPDIRQQQINP